MKRAVSTDDIIQSIEFELAQSAITQTELGASLNAVRQFQNKTRVAAFESNEALKDPRAAFRQQFQVNDMHLTLLQEVVATLQALQLDLRRLEQLPRRETPADPGISTAHDRVPPSPLGQPPVDDEYAVEPLPVWSNELIENAMKADALKLNIDVRTSSLPLIGGLIRRVRTAFHNLTLFYVQQMGHKQGAINQIYGERLLQLSQLVADQQQQIEMLRARIAALTGQTPDS